MIKCPECQKEVSQFALACPSCGHPVAETVNAAKKDKGKLEKKKMWAGLIQLLGLLLLIVGFGTFLTARKSADSLIQSNYENGGAGGVAADDALAKAAGHESYADYLTEQNQKSGMACATLGAILMVVGYKVFKGTKTSTSVKASKQSEIIIEENLNN